MTIKRTEHVRSFVAVDERGVGHTVHVTVDIISTATSENPRGERRSIQVELRAADGGPVHWLGKGKYQFHTGVVVHSDDPDAP